MPEKRVILIISCLVILLITIPYIYAFQEDSTEYAFGGFLINPTDGHSYLAKMQLGYQGGWKFVLPYTAESGEGAYLFLFYIGLGHLARIVNLPLLAVFHIARVIGAIFLLWVLKIYFRSVFKEPKMQTLGFSIAALGSGVGWLAVVFGSFTSDFWVAEAYPFLSKYTNPHFSLGLLGSAHSPCSCLTMVRNIGCPGGRSRPVGQLVTGSGVSRNCAGPGGAKMGHQGR